VGREIPHELLALLHGVGGDDLQAQQDELVRRGILEQRRPDALHFVHDKIREVAYNELSPARRVLLHRRVAHALERARRRPWSSIGVRQPCVGSSRSSRVHPYCAG